jgi:hypothetical protein
MTFNFPNGAQYGSIAKQFESHLAASSSCGMKASFQWWLRARSVSSNSSHRRLSRETLWGTEEYLARKFDVHGCPAEIEERDTGSEPAT